MNYLILFLEEEKQINLIIDFLKGLLGANIKTVIKEEIIVSYDKKEEVDFKEISNVINNELYVKCTLLECYTSDLNYLEELINLYKLKINYTCYLNEKELLLIKNNNEILRKNILKKYYNDGEMQNIIKVYLECDLNTTTAASKLYLHRNTLNNKIDKFINETGYNVRTFKEAYIIYQLI